MKISSHIVQARWYQCDDPCTCLSISLHFGITVMQWHPCFAMTALTKARLEDPEYRDMVLGMIPVGRVVEPSEVGAAFNYLASDEAAMITGQTLVTRWPDGPCGKIIYYFLT